MSAVNRNLLFGELPDTIAAYQTKFHNNHFNLNPHQKQIKDVNMNKLIVLALVASACLAAVATAKPTGESELDFSSALCEGCKVLVDQAKANLPQVRPQLDQLCSYCGSAEATQKCLDKLHEVEDQLEKQSPEEVCKAVGLCQARSFSFQDFMGTF